MHYRILALLVAGLFGAISGDVSRRAALIRPTAEEMRWKEIPWITSLAEAQKVAAKERRPLFIWTDDDDPLDRC